jgi:ABC-type proline/glycine betaine transport system substrate-binding protein
MLKIIAIAVVLAVIAVLALAAAEGVGAVYDFAGNGKQVGTGRITMTESVPATKVTMRLQMFKPIAADNVVT